MIFQCFAFLAVLAQINAYRCNPCCKTETTVFDYSKDQCKYQQVVGPKQLTNCRVQTTYEKCTPINTTPVTRSVVAKGKYPVKLPNCGSAVEKKIPVFTSHVRTPVQEKPTVRLPAKIPPTQTVSHTCTCYRTIVKPRVQQQLITVPSIQRYIETKHTPVVENIMYEAFPFLAGNTGNEQIVTAQTFQVPLDVDRVHAIQIPQVTTTNLQTVEIPRLQFNTQPQAIEFQPQANPPKMQFQFVEIPNPQTQIRVEESPKVEIPHFQFFQTSKPQKIEIPQTQVEQPPKMQIEIPRFQFYETSQPQKTEISQVQVEQPQKMQVEIPHFQLFETPKPKNTETPCVKVEESPKLQVEVPSFQFFDTPKAQNVEIPRIQKEESPKMQVEIPRFQFFESSKPQKCEMPRLQTEKQIEIPRFQYVEAPKPQKREISRLQTEQKVEIPHFQYVEASKPQKREIPLLQTGQQIEIPRFQFAEPSKPQKREIPMIQTEQKIELPHFQYVEPSKAQKREIPRLQTQQQVEIPRFQYLEASKPQNNVESQRIQNEESQKRQVEIPRFHAPKSQNVEIPHIQTEGKATQRQNIDRLLEVPRVQKYDMTQFADPQKIQQVEGQQYVESKVSGVSHTRSMESPQKNDPHGLPSRSFAYSFNQQ